MARLTLSDIRSKAREITEVSTADVSDGLLDLFVRDGYNRIIDLERRWPFLEVSFEMTVTANQRKYNIDDFSVHNIREVASVVDPSNHRLTMISLDEAEQDYLGVQDAAGRPMFVSYWGGEMYFFPTPAQDYTFQVRAYREAEDWVTAGTVPDGVEAFDLALVDYAVSRIYKMQEAFQPAQEFERSFNDTVAFARRDVMKADSYAPVRLSSGGAGRRWDYMSF